MDLQLKGIGKGSFKRSVFPGVADGFLVFVNEFQAIAVTELVA
jgi:hypothetical protein